MDLAKDLYRRLSRHPRTRDSAQAAAMLADTIVSGTERIGLGQPVKPGTSELKHPAVFIPFELQRFSTQAAQLWFELSPTTRSQLLEMMHREARNDEVGGIATILQALSRLTVLSDALGALKKDTEVILKKQDLLLKEIKTANEALLGIQEALGESELVKARKSVQHLLNAMNSDVSIVKNQQFQLASDGFQELTQLDPRKETIGTSGAIDNINLIVFGYWGLHQYFAQLGDYRNAQIQVYECAAIAPAQALLVFPAASFTRDYKNIAGRILEEHQRANEELAVLEEMNKLARNSQSRKEIVQQFKGMAVGFGVFAALSYTGMAGAVAGAAAYREVSKSRSTAELLDTAPAERRVEQTLGELDELTAEFYEECRAQLSVLRQVNPEDLGAFLSSHIAY